MSAANSTSPDQFQLFGDLHGPERPPEMEHDPAAWSSRGDIVHHASDSPTMPAEKDDPWFGTGFHTGTHQSAVDRSMHGQLRDYIHPTRMTGSMALRPETHSAPKIYNEQGRPTMARERRQVWADDTANSSGLRHREDAEQALGQGLTVPYANAAEDQGSVSFRSPREHLKSWSEDVQSDPGASPEHKKIAEHFDLTEPIGERTYSVDLTRGRQRPQKITTTQSSLLPDVVPEETVVSKPKREKGPKFKAKPPP